MKRNTHTIVPGSNFKLVAGEDNLSCYQVSSVQTAWQRTCVLSREAGSGSSSQGSDGMLIMQII